MTEFSISTIDKGASSEIAKDNFPIDQQGVTAWLQTKNIISGDEILHNFQDLMPWTRTGGETFCASFQFSTNRTTTKQIFIKAITTTSPEKSLTDWAKRRKILAEHEIPVSNWYFYGDGVIFEDFYPKVAKNVVAFEKIIAIGHKLDQLGFTTLKFLDDIRATEDGSPFYIDFGFDLGEPSSNLKTNAKEYLLKQYPDKENQINQFYEGK